jgi:O-antigen/teichoic acid export membrane protein
VGDRRLSERPGTDPAAVVPASATPTSEPATLAVNTGIMVAARVYLLVASGALSIYAIRTFSTESYGRFAIASALIMIFGLLSEMGIATIALRELAMESERARDVLATAVWAELITSVIAAVLMFPTALALGYGDELLGLLAIGAAIILVQGLLAAVEASFQARRVLVYSAALVATQATLAVTVGFVLVANGAGPKGLLAGTLAGYIAATPVGFLLARKRLGIRPELRGAWRGVPQLIRAALPVAATGGTAIIYDRVDVLMLSQLDSVRSAAIYNVPLTILQYSALVPSIVATAFFALLAGLLRTDPPAARDAFGLILRIFALLSVPIALVLTFGGETVLTTLFGARYRGSAAPLSVLAWSVVLAFLNYLFWYSLLAAYREGAKFRIMLAGLALNVSLNVVLIPAYGPTGAAVSLLCSDFVVVAWQGLLIRRHLFEIPFTRLLVKPAIALALALPAALLLRPIGGLPAGVAGALVYAGALLSLRYISLEEWQPLLQPARRLAGRAWGLAARG